MKIGIIGAGFTGLSAAYYLQKKGHTVTIFEKDPRPGGLAIGYQEKEWDWSLESFYHHWFTNDNAILQLAREIDFPVITKRPKTSSFIANQIYQLDSPLTLLKFQKLKLIDRLRMGVVLAFLRYNPFWQPFEKISAHTFLSKTLGKSAYEILWQPILFNKFGAYTKNISLAWFWARIVKRTSSLAYPEGGFLHFAKALEGVIIKNGGEIFYNTAVDGITKTKEGIKLTKEHTTFDKVIVTLPSFAFTRLAPNLPQDYQKKLLSLQGIGAVIVVMRLTKPFFKDNTYWLNVCDNNAPVLAIVEHTNFMNPVHYHNEHIVYLGNYLPKEHPYFSYSEEKLLTIFDPVLKKINKDYKKNIIGLKKFSVPFAQPIYSLNYSKTIPPFTTPIKNVYLANMQQVYPWDRGTNYAVELGKKIADFITEHK